MEKPIDRMEVKRIVDMISFDESIAALCLRLANSALYFLPQTVKTIHGAAVLLGVRQVREILLACPLLNLLPKEESTIPALALWEHSLGCALMSKDLRYPQVPNCRALQTIGGFPISDYLRFCFFLPKKQIEVGNV
jgi:HD-like signal output (HDOD) protein